jgi:hypothetical protein
MQLQQRVCDDAPFSVLGPLVTDVFLAPRSSPAPSAPAKAARAGRPCSATSRRRSTSGAQADDVKAGCIAQDRGHAGIARGRHDPTMGRRPVARRAASTGAAVRAGVRRRDGTRAPRRGPRGRRAALCHVRPDWCMRISRRSSIRQRKDPGFQPARKSMRSPSVVRRAAFARPARSRFAVVGTKHACHSELVSDAEQCAVSRRGTRRPPAVLTARPAVSAEAWSNVPEGTRAPAGIANRNLGARRPRRNVSAGTGEPTRVPPTLSARASQAVKIVRR